MNKICIYMSSQNYEESGYSFDSDLLAITYQSRVSHPRRSRLFGNSSHSRPLSTLDVVMEDNNLMASMREYCERMSLTKIINSRMVMKLA